MNNIKTGAVVVRFQTPELTKGHLHLLSEALRMSTKLVVLIGTSPTRLANRNGLSFEIRRDMILNEFRRDYNIEVLEIKDQQDNAYWSTLVDETLAPYENVTLYGSRDCFITSYSGKYPFVQVSEVESESATQIRNSLKEYNPEYNNVSFRRGIIHAIENKFPVAYPTVDIALINFDTQEILLGRKPNQKIWVLMGGFVDPTDTSLEVAAGRELHEEVKNIQTHGVKYVKSAKVDDWRYRGTTDGIITSLFISYFLSGNPKAGDDLDEVKWYFFDEAVEVIGNHHADLLKTIIELVKSEKNK